MLSFQVAFNLTLMQRTEIAVNDKRDPIFINGEVL